MGGIKERGRCQPAHVQVPLTGTKLASISLEKPSLTLVWSVLSSQAVIAEPLKTVGSGGEVLVVWSEPKSKSYTIVWGDFVVRFEHRPLAELVGTAKANLCRESAMGNFSFFRKGLLTLCSRIGFMGRLKFLRCRNSTQPFPSL